MITTKKFEELHNKEVERTYLISLLEQARKENNRSVVSRISKILKDNPSVELFRIFVKKTKNQVPIKKKRTAVKKELVPMEFLAGLDYIEADDSELATGLGKPVTPEQVYKMITEKVIKGVEKAKGNPSMPWDESFLASGGYLIPHNYSTKKAYRGVNILLLKNGNPYAGFKSPYFLTFKQVQELKGKVKPKSRGLEVIYFTRLFTFSNQDKKQSFSTYKKQKMITFLKSKGYNANQFDLLVKVIPILKYYKVFNAVDIEGIDFGLKNLSALEKAKLGYVQPSKARHDDTKNTLAELIIKNLPTPKISIKHQGNSAYYTSNEDAVYMPKFESFDSANDYYRVLFHELIHSTGHINRLDRELGHKFGSVKYAKEELIAEFGSVFLSAQAGILWHTHGDHEKYIKNWLLAISLMQKDNTLLMRSATKAQKAVDYLLQVNSEGEPKFYEELKKEVTTQKPKPKPKEKPKQLVLALNGISKKSETIAFNKQLLEASKKGYTNDTIFILGTPNGILKKHIENFIISFDGKTLRTIIKETSKNTISWNHLIDLPDSMNNPLAIFKGKTSGYVVLTEIKETSKKSLLVAIHISKELKLTKITSINGTSSLYKKWINQGLDLYISKKSKLYNYQKPQKKETAPSLNTPAVAIQNIVVEEKTEIPCEEIETVIETIPAVKEIIPGPTRRSSLASKREERKNKVQEYYTISDTAIASFLGKIERKEKESVVITLTGGQGSMKTRCAFRFMNAFAQNYKVGHASIEEHPESTLYWNKVNDYINNVALNNIENPEIGSSSDLDQVIRNNDVIIIDSFAKMQELEKGFEVDKDLRKKYDGKLFIVIFQQTSDGKMRGGTKSQYDADIVLFTEKFDDYKHNFVYADKNRYQNQALNELKYNIYNGVIVNENEALENDHQELVLNDGEVEF
ncbi:zincin-like metallopeptidase domain-containing protein [Tenacibaculum halocynthiae]|uniref:zincin-like metallopeptidase domain-containing protein n=1 Tax=Tenacibaculum halocynthiae TaxID=1254437 RepID=UPI0038937FCE